jgi:hypothetical protein
MECGSTHAARLRHLGEKPKTKPCAASKKRHAFMLNRSLPHGEPIPADGPSEVIEEPAVAITV